MDVVWIASAFVLGVVVNRFSVPPLVGYLAAGVGLSLYGYEPGDMLHEVSHLGVLFLLFTVGLHIKLKNLLRYDVLGVGGIHLLISVALFTPLTLYYGLSPTAAVVVAILLGFSSTVLTAKNLEQRNELGSLYGRIAIGILILQDVVAIVVIAWSGGQSPSLWSLGLLALPLVRPAIIWAFKYSGDVEELHLLFGLMLALGGGALFEVSGLSSELGALVAGMLLAGQHDAEELSKKLWGLKEAFLVGFFLEVGLTGLPDIDDLYLVLGALLLLPVKALLFFGLMLLFKLRARTSFIATVTLSSYSEFILIAGAVAVEANLIADTLLVALALLTALSFIVNAPLAYWEEQIWEKMEHTLVKLERNVKHPERQPISLGSANYMIAGMGNAGAAAYDYLKKSGMAVVGMDFNPDRIQNNREAKRRTIYGDVQDPEFWERLDIGNIRSIILAAGTQETKINATRIMRKNGFKGKILALTLHEKEYRNLKEAGANAVCIPITQAGEKLAELSLSDNVDEDPGEFRYLL